MIVIDASSLTKYILKEKNWQEIRNKINEPEPVYSIDYVVVEATNSIWKENLKKNLSESEALLKHEALEMACIEVLHLESSKNYIKEALKLGMVEKTTVYDALYVVQAIRYGKLLTSDGAQSELAIKLGVETTFIK